MTTGRRPAAGRAPRPVRRAAAAALVAVGAIVGATALMAVGDDGGAVGAQIPRTVPSVQPSSDPAGAPRTPAAEPAPLPSTLPDVPVVETDPVPAPATAQPERLLVRGLLDVPVRPVGVDPDGSMELPRSGDVAGWYRFGPTPGDDAGTVVLASHVDTLDGVGAFAGLTSVKVGRVVVVTDADGARHEYTVSTIERFAKEAVPLESIFTRTGKPRLVLVTCGGRWDAAAGRYEDNLVVTATA